MIVGLTGGIATGKTTVSRMFRDLGATLVCADELGHQAIHSTGDAYEEIIARFDGTIPRNMLIKPDGEIDRRVLGYHVFLNPGEMYDLERIVHPCVERLFEKFVQEFDNDDTVLIYECALLFETSLEDRLEPPMSYTIATWCPEEVQVARLMLRDSLDRSEALQRMEKQMPPDTKRMYADFDIDTSASDIINRVRYIYDTLRALIPIRQEVKRLLSKAKLIDSYPDQQILTAGRVVPVLHELD